MHEPKQRYSESDDEKSENFRAYLGYGSIGTLYSHEIDGCQKNHPFNKSNTIVVIRNLPDIMNNSILLETLGIVKAPSPPTSIYKITPRKEETLITLYEEGRKKNNSVERKNSKGSCQGLDSYLVQHLRVFLFRITKQALIRLLRS